MRDSRLLLLGFLPALVMAALCGPALVKVWWRDSYAAHGGFALAFSLFLLFDDRRRLLDSRGRGEPLGLLGIVLGLGLFLFGMRIGSLPLQAMSFAPVLAGAVALAFGPVTLRQAAFPLGFLIFMSPLPRLFVRGVTGWLQDFSAAMAASVTSLLGVPIFQNGRFLELPGTSLEVAEICNGLRFLSALVVLTVAYAHMTQRTLSRKALLSLAAVPVAILANAARVTVVTLAVYYIGPQAASGWLHHSIGKAVWALTLVPLLVLGWYLRREPGERFSGEPRHV